MRPARLAPAVGLLAAALAWRPAVAEEPAPPAAPVLAGVFPPGITIGTATRWVVDGRHLGQVERFLLSGRGVDVLRHERDEAGRLVLTVHAEEAAAPGYRELRADGPGGVSNLVLFRVDPLPQVEETEPNDSIEDADPLPASWAFAGVLAPRDVDHVRIAGRGGSWLSVEVEARRLGTPVAPVLTLSSGEGRALAQARSTPGLDGDARLTCRLPADGDYVVQLRDNLYGGGPSASYRLRVGVSDGPGNAATALPQSSTADGSGVVEAPDGGTTRLPLEATAIGRIARPGEVDRYLVAARKGQAIRVRVVASAAGSRLDSVVRLKDPRGRTVGENDDGAIPDALRGRARVVGSFDPTTDSHLDVVADDDGDLTVEVRDRYGEWGPEYGYRLTVGPPRPDFSVALELPGAGEGPAGVLNLAPGTTRDVGVRIAFEGRTGPIRVRAEGLPRGVSARPLTIAPRGSAGGGGGTAVQVATGVLTLRVAPDAAPGRGDLVVSATAAAGDETPLVRVASTAVPIGSWPPSTPGGPLLRELGSVPVRITAPGSPGRVGSSGR